jgi:hypothetical protein
MCPDTKPPAQVHEMMVDADNPSIASDTSSIIILAQDEGRSSIGPNFLFLDSQSTVYLFSNPKHVTIVHPTATNNVADFGENKVYLNAVVIDHVLSLYLFGKNHHITYDSHDCGGVFKVHTSAGCIEFKQTPKGSLCS